MLSPSSNSPSQGLALQHATLHTRSTQPSLHVSSASSAGEPRTAPSSPIDSEEDLEDRASLRVGMVVHRTEDGYASRANTLYSYLELNRHVRIVQDPYTQKTHPHIACLVSGTNELVLTY